MEASILIVSRVVAVTFAFSITATSYRAYRRTGDRTFQLTMLGFAMLVIGLGIGLGTHLFYSVPMTLTEIHIVQSSVFALGFLILYLSLTGWQVSVGR
ncbi:MAG: hypothetical protein V5A36_07380 [Natronomonas sp.]